MNERIQELAEQAIVPFKDENLIECYHFSKEKFAELIVKECAEFYEKSADNWFGADSKFILNMYADRIKQHFGVK